MLITIIVLCVAVGVLLCAVVSNNSQIAELREYIEPKIEAAQRRFYDQRFYTLRAEMLTIFEEAGIRWDISTDPLYQLPDYKIRNLHDLICQLDDLACGERLKFKKGANKELQLLRDYLDVELKEEKTTTRTTPAKLVNKKPTLTRRVKRKR